MLNFNKFASTPDLYQVLESKSDSILYNKLNCVRVGIVQEFYPESMQVKVQIANKVVKGLNEDGSQILDDYAPIFAKVYFLGGHNNGVSHPLSFGDEGIILFNDRELESWYINGDVNQLAYDRCHNITDAIFICGLYSQPNISLTQYISECLNVYYGASGVQIKNNSINLKTGDLKINNNSGVSGSFTTKDNKTVTVTNGIITSIV